MTVEPEGVGLAVTLEPDVLAVQPGERAAFSVRIANRTDADVLATITFSGDVAAWAWTASPSLTLAPGDETVVQVGIRLPPPPSPAAGPAPLSVEVRAGGAAAVRTATVDVLPVVGVSASLGRTDGGAARVPLTVRNKGNTRVLARLSAEGATVEPAEVAIGPGDVATVFVARRGRRAGSFTVRVEADGAEPVLLTGTSAGGGRAGVRLPGWRILVPVVVGALVVGALLVSRGAGSSGSASSGDGDGTGVAASAPDDPNCPARNHLSADFNGIKRPGVIAPIQYSFLEVRPGGCEPVRFNPCEPVHYVTNSALAPQGALADLDAALGELSAATGLQFVNDGPTDEPASLTRPIVQARYGQRWAPVLIVWEHGGPLRLGDTNPGGGRGTNVNGVYVSGILILNVDAISSTTTRRPLQNGFGEGATWGRVMIHEMAHIIGLGHVRSTAEIMFDDVGIQKGRAEYHAGDLAGLRLLGKDVGCVTAPAPFAPPTTRR